MAYEPRFTSQTKIAALTQFTAGLATTPSEAQILNWIQEVEIDADARFLASYTVTDQIIDVHPQLDYPAKETIAWLESIAGKTYEEISTSIITPPFIPIVSVTSLYRRTTTLTQTTVWELLTEGPGSSGSFILLRKGTKTGQFLGFGIYFYQNQPDVGLGRIKITYVYGWNLSAVILGEWCSLKVALKVLEALKEANTPISSGDYSLLDLRVGLVDIEIRAKGMIQRIGELEEQYFPKKKLGIAIF